MTAELTLHALFGVLLAATALLPRRRAALAGTGLAAYAVGAGAFAAVPAIVRIGPLAAKLAAVGLSPVFVGVNVGLMALGAGVVMVAALFIVANEERWALRLAGLVAAAAAIAVLAALVPLLRIAGLAAGATAGAALALGGMMTFAARAIASRVRPAGSAHESSVSSLGLRELPRIPVAITAVAAALTLVAPHALLVIAAALVTAVAAHVAARRMGRAARVPVLPIAATALVPFAWMLTTVAGPVGLATGSLSLVPLSPPAQALIAPALVAGAWGFLGAWPLHRWVPGPVLAAVAGALMLRIGAPALGAGFEHLQPPLFALGTVAAWHAALTRRAAAFLAALGFVASAAIFSGAQVAADARIAAAVLFAAATGAAALHELARSGSAAHAGAAVSVATRVFALAAAAAIYLTIGAGLRAEVVLTVALVGAAAVASWRILGDAAAR